MSISDTVWHVNVYLTSSGIRMSILDSLKPECQYYTQPDTWKSILDTVWHLNVNIRHSLIFECQYLTLHVNIRQFHIGVSMLDTAWPLNVQCSIITLGKLLRPGWTDNGNFRMQGLENPYVEIAVFMEVVEPERPFSSPCIRNIPLSDQPGRNSLPRVIIIKFLPVVQCFLNS